ncbi:sensor histidine kinase [Actinocrispum wychmicini]|uniref:histidine kinase n=1 Tax=Actinocrispum wychmicini TaxID=1213861 RepID=A0A4R2JGI3_9PSEU|nr:HAMP domain-containing sensor histidine kinase [Actinocrispum wychmicini]TCO55998.1 two-component system sensor histidine kinase MtrB [Actinocrispum wychmicini]
MTRGWPRIGLRARVIVAVVLLTVTTTAAVAFAAYVVQSTQTTDRFTAAAKADISSDVNQAKAQLRSTSDRVAVVSAYMQGRQGVSWALIDFGSPGHVVEHDGRFTVLTRISADTLVAVDLPAALVGEALAGGVAAQALDTSTRAPVLAVVARVDSDLVLAEFYNRQPLRAELTTLARTLAVIALVVGVLGVVAALVAANRIQRPVRLVAVAARKLGDGALDTRLPVRGRDELAELTRSFNAMAHRLGESIEQLQAKDRQQRRFVADVAHDLRTPVAAMVAAVDGLQHPEADAQARSARLLGAQARRLATLVEDLLEISRFDAGVAELRPEPVDLHDLVQDAIAMTAGSADVSLRADGDVTVVGDPRRVHTIARNLLVNALRHGAEPITVTIDGTGPDVVTVRVADSGPGIRDDLMPILFDRFVRGDQARTATEGSGLGLAIARENATVHGGRLDVHNADGAVFTLTLPRAVRPVPRSV